MNQATIRILESGYFYLSSYIIIKIIILARLYCATAAAALSCCCLLLRTWEPTAGNLNGKPVLEYIQFKTFSKHHKMEPSSQPGVPQQQPTMATSIATTLPRSILREPPPLLPTMATLPRSIPPEPPPLSSIPPEPPPLLPTMVTSTATPILPRRIPPEKPPLLEHEGSGTHFHLIYIISKPLIHRLSNSTRDSLQLHVPTKKRKYRRNFCQL